MQDNSLEYAEKLAESGFKKRSFLINLGLGQLNLPDGFKNGVRFSTLVLRF